MIIKTEQGVYKRKEEVSEKENFKIISSEDIFIIKNFFNEEFFGVFDRDTIAFINTNIKFTTNN